MIVNSRNCGNRKINKKHITNKLAPWNLNPRIETCEKISFLRLEKVERKWETLQKGHTETWETLQKGHTETRETLWNRNPEICENLQKGNTNRDMGNSVELKP